jgi:hypothetical protein
MDELDRPLDLWLDHCLRVHPSRKIRNRQFHINDWRGILSSFA